MKLRIHNHLLFFYHKHIRKTYGICSRVKYSCNLHYLLFDIDMIAKLHNTNEDIPMQDVISYFRAQYPYSKKLWYSTPHGIHVIIFEKHSFKNAIRELVECPWVDLKWVAIGIKRGYWFLESHSKIVDDDLTYMMVER